MERLFLIKVDTPKGKIRVKRRNLSDGLRMCCDECGADGAECHCGEAV